MKLFYNEIVSFNIAVRLKCLGFNYRTRVYYLSGGTRDYSDIEKDWNSMSYKDLFSAPEYSQVLTWLLNRGIYIEMVPGLTYALSERFAFEFNIHRYIEKEGIIEKIENTEFASFGLSIETAVNDAITILEKDNDGETKKI